MGGGAAGSEVATSEAPTGGGFPGQDVQAYYRTLAPYLDRPSLRRGDEAFWRWVAARRPGSVLELGAGAGRVTRLLARGATETVALDLSREMLRRARRKLAGTPRVLLLAADLRHPPLARRFDLVVAANDPLSHLTSGADRNVAFDAVVRRLRPGGLFILDAFWLSPAEVRRASRPGGSATERPVEGEDGLRVREEWWCEPGQKSCRVRFTYLRDERVLAEATTRLRPWTPAEVRSRLLAAGLRPLNLWGDYDRTPWRENRARALVVEARRP